MSISKLSFVVWKGHINWSHVISLTRQQTLGSIPLNFILNFDLGVVFEKFLPLLLFQKRGKKPGFIIWKKTDLQKNQS